MTTTDRATTSRSSSASGPTTSTPRRPSTPRRVISHEYGHSLGLPDFYSTGGRETYGDWNLMATDKSHHIDAYGRQELGWVVPEVLDATTHRDRIPDSKPDIDAASPGRRPTASRTPSRGRTAVSRLQMYLAKLPGRDPARPGDVRHRRLGHRPTRGGRVGQRLRLRDRQRQGDTRPRAAQLAALPGHPGRRCPSSRMWDIEWDYDYGYVITSTDGGKDFASHPSEKGFTT